MATYKLIFDTKGNKEGTLDLRGSDIPPTLRHKLYELVDREGSGHRITGIYLFSYSEEVGSLRHKLEDEIRLASKNRRKDVAFAFWNRWYIKLSAILAAIGIIRSCE